MNKLFLLTTAVSGLSLGMSSAMSVVMIDTFGDGNPLTNTDGTVPAGYDSTYSTEITDGAAGSITESGGSQAYNPGAGNWTRSELSANHDYANPASGGSLKLSWTVGNVAVTNDRAPNTSGGDGYDYRIQLNAHSANRAQGGGSERWLVTEGSLSLDLFFNSTDAGTAPSLDMVTRTKTDDQLVSTDGSLKTTTIINLSAWDWLNTTNTFSLEITDTGYAWSDNLGLLNYSEDFGAAGSDFDAVPAEFQNGYWAHTSQQNNDSGRGNAVMEEFRSEVTAVPEPTSALLSLLSLGLLAKRRR